MNDELVANMRQLAQARKLQDQRTEIDAMLNQMNTLPVDVREDLLDGIVSYLRMVVRNETGKQNVIVA